MSRTLNVRVLTEGLDLQADRLERVLDRAALALAAVDAVNVVTQRADKTIRAGEISDINLSDTYVRSKTDIKLAVREPRAEITAKGDLTIMGRYPWSAIVQTASQRAKGDPSRGVPAGMKAAGTFVQIKRSAGTFQPKWFTMKLRSGNQAGSNVGVFVRVGSGRGDVRHLYGPSPYSLFRFQAGQQLDSIADDLQRTTDQALAERLDRSL